MSVQDCVRYDCEALADAITHPLFRWPSEVTYTSVPSGISGNG